mgnify:CR=1 FL=1|jgi:hypothetical protein
MILALALVLLIVSAIVFLRWRKKTTDHSEVTSEDHLLEILDLVQSMKEEISTAEPQKKQTHYRSSELKFVITYITSTRPNSKIVHGLSISRVGLRLKSAALVAQLIISYLDQEESWTPVLKVSQKSIYHFHFDLDPEAHPAFVQKKHRSPNVVLDLLSEIQKKSQDIKIKRIPSK